MSDKIMVVEDVETAGAVVFWAMNGPVPLADLEDQADFEGLEAGLLPKPPTVMTTAKRAAERAVAGYDGPQRKYKLHRVKRGMWDIIAETVLESDPPKLRFDAIVRITVPLKSSLEDDQEPVPSVEPHPEWDNDAGRGIAANVRSLLPQFAGLLMASDVSGWLVTLLEREIRAVSLRPRGGFYFVPAGEALERWRLIVRVLRAVSGHQLFEVPAMRSDEAVAAVLTALRRETEAVMQEIEDYLAGTVSTRGLNAYQKTLEELRAKTRSYVELLGEELPDLDERNTRLSAGIAQARAMNQS